MIQEICPVKSVEQVAEGVYVLTFASRSIANTAQAGQFVNLKTDRGIDPLLRRPFSVYHSQGDDVQVIFHVIGKGTAALRSKRAGEPIDVLGPLGVPFSIQKPDFDTAILLGGGLGVAPLPMLTRALSMAGKAIVTFLGSRTGSIVADRHLKNVHIATDDGSRGFHGNIVELLKKTLEMENHSRPMVFACGPTMMLRALQAYVIEKGIPCEASLEGPMGCGFGICQGCPVELVGAEKKYALMCKDGPTFNLEHVKV